MSKFLAYDEVIIEQHENYQKGGYRNRAHIIGANGIERLSVPLKSGKHQQKPIRDVEIAYDEPWHIVHWRALKTACSSAAYFDHYAPKIKSILMAKHRFLFELNMELLVFLCESIRLTKPAFTTDFERISLGPQDLRNSIKPGNTSEDINFRALPYFQVFDDRHGFTPNLSCIDLLFALGPEAKSVLRRSVVLTC